MSGSTSRAIRRTINNAEAKKRAAVAQRVLLKHKALRGAWYDCLVEVEVLLSELDKRTLPTELGEAAELVRAKLEAVRVVAAEVEGVTEPEPDPLPPGVEVPVYAGPLRDRGKGPDEPA